MCEGVGRMRVARETRSRRRVLVGLLLAVVVPSALMLLWLGMALFRQDRELLAQRLEELQQRATEVALWTLERQLAAVDTATGVEAEGLVRLRLTGGGVEATPAGALLWWPGGMQLPDAAAAPFADGEALEFRGNADGALAIYTRLARSPRQQVRAGAWLRVARVHRAAGRWDAALQAYTRLEAIDDVAIAGAPAALQARRATVTLLGEAGRRDAQAAAATALADALLASRWRLDREGWELAWADVEVAGASVPQPDERRLASLAAEVAWRRAAALPPRESMPVDGAMVTLIRAAADPRAVVVALPRATRRWSEAARHEAGLASLRLLPRGDARDGRHSPAATVIGAEASGLPWTVVMAPVDQRAVVAQMATRRRLLLAGLATLLALVGGSGYLLWRGVSRELEVARQKSDFVAAVSHEFRTPLTALGHLAELLEEDDDLPPERRRELYAALGRNTARLRRLVESLLDFARLEAGRRPYALQPLAPAALARAVVDEFQREASRDVILDVDDEALHVTVMADGAALTNALWNLLDNAVKYSPPSTPVRVDVNRGPAGVTIAVRDGGPGVPPAERAAIFDRFVRGSRARELGVPGTGLGLALVTHIAAAHGGRVELDSEEGAGSTFRLVLPAAG
jgi:two-component system phosphate regulon sensor histidine kinase PhoR